MYSGVGVSLLPALLEPQVLGVIQKLGYAFPFERFALAGSAAPAGHLPGWDPVLQVIEQIVWSKSSRIWFE